MFEFKAPVSKKVWKWRPLTVGDEMDVVLEYTGAKERLAGFELLRRRIISIGTSENGAPIRMEVGEWRKQDPLDVDAFSDEVTAKEEARKKALAPSSDSPLVES